MSSIKQQDVEKPSEKVQEEKSCNEKQRPPVCKPKQKRQQCIGNLSETNKKEKEKKGGGMVPEAMNKDRKEYVVGKRGRLCQPENYVKAARNLWNPSGGPDHPTLASSRCEQAQKLSTRTKNNGRKGRRSASRWQTSQERNGPSEVKRCLQHLQVHRGIRNRQAKRKIEQHLEAPSC